MSVTNRKMFRSRNARNKLNQMGGIMASSPELMNTVQRFNLGGNVNIGTQPQINRRNVNAGIPTVNPPANLGARSGAPPYAQVGRPPTLPYASQIMDFLGSTFGPETLEERQARGQRGQAIAERLSVPENAPIRNLPEALQPKDGPARGIITGMTIPEKLASIGLGPEVGRRITDPDEIARLLETPEGRAQSPTDEPRPGADVVTMRGPTAKDMSELADRLPSAENIEDASPEEQVAAGKQIQEEVTGLLASEEVDEDTKNDVILTMLDKKEPGEKLSKAEQIKKNREAYRELFGMDPEKDKQIDGYNLAMMGFLIASGDSPNALQNIARGAAAGLKNFQKTKEKRQERDDRLTELAVREYENTRRSEKAEEQFRMNYNLKVQELEDRRNQAETEADRERFNNILRFLDDDAYKLAYVQLDEAGVDIGTDEGFKQLNDLRTSILARQPDLLKSSIKNEAMPTRQEYVLTNTAEALKNYDILDSIARDLGVEPSSLKTQNIRNFYGRMYDEEMSLGLQSPRTSGGQASAPQQVSTRKEYDALPSGTAYVDPQGNRGVKP